MRDRSYLDVIHADDDYKHPVPGNSYSRELDSRVQAEEMPYGYLEEPPAADSGNYNSSSYETKKIQKGKK